MDVALPAEDDPRRASLRRWLEEHPHPTARQLAEAGLVAPHWPTPWGLGADPTHQLIVDDELRRAGIRRPDNTIGIGWAGPTIVQAGTAGQKDRYLLSLLAGEDVWCQLFSEPGAGSDLAALTTRAELDGDEWVVQGQKIWTSYAHVARYGILLARTEPESPRHEGISYFICPMDAPGVTVRPLTDMTGTHTFNEVFLDGVRLAPDSLVGERGRGWSLAKVTLGNERVSLSGSGSLWGMGPTAADLVDLVRRSGGTADPLERQRLASVWAEGRILSWLRKRTVTAAVAGLEPGPEVSVRKALADAHGQHVMGLANDLAGAGGMIQGTGPTGPAGVGTSGHPAGPDPIWGFGFLFGPALTIGGGTAEVQRNIIAERTLGLPRDPPA
ncbi:MAG TPA: acyl-CoA dehydrogenase family protein [Acidimicrobiales bacterium]|jgi:alkylation response protein AidB-like acyl-CoA dehydrogenase|nr:acyl-CoA dehydrogenase family protein [Acidimicrobiales bacterium]